MLTEQDKRRAYFRKSCSLIPPAYRQHRRDKADPEKRDEYVEVRQKAMNLGAEMVLAAFIQDVFSLLIDRARKCDGYPNGATAAQRWLHDLLPPAVAEGRRGLNHAMIEGIIGREPRIAGGRPPRNDDRENVFRQYQESGSWVDRLRGLFLYDDLGDRTRSWETQSFRTLTRHLVGIASQVVGANGAEMFLRNLIIHASKRLFIIPQYDLEHLSIIFKAKKNHTAQRQAEIKSSNLLTRSNWYLAAFAQTRAGMLRMNRAPREDDGTPAVGQQVAQNILCQEVDRQRLEVSTERTSSSLWLTDPAAINLDVESPALVEMKDDLEAEADYIYISDNSSEDEREP